MRLLRCSAQVNRFRNLFLQRVALSNETSNTKKCINSPHGNVGGSYLADECNGNDQYVFSTDIRTIRLDDYWNTVLNRRRPHHMKIDVEGYEMKCFLGAEEMLTTAPPYTILSELSGASLKANGFTSLDYINHMETFGYKTYSANHLLPYDKKIVPDDDIIFVHKDILTDNVEHLDTFFGLNNKNGASSMLPLSSPSPSSFPSSSLMTVCDHQQHQPTPPPRRLRRFMCRTFSLSPLILALPTAFMIVGLFRAVTNDLSTDPAIGLNTSHNPTQPFHNGSPYTIHPMVYVVSGNYTHNSRSSPQNQYISSQQGFTWDCDLDDNAYGIPRIGNDFDSQSLGNAMANLNAFQTRIKMCNPVTMKHVLDLYGGDDICLPKFSTTMDENDRGSWVALGKRNYGANECTGDQAIYNRYSMEHLDFSTDELQDRCSHFHLETRPKPHIPKIVHFVFGLQADFGGQPFMFVNYMAIKMARDSIQPQIIYFHYHFEPTGRWWELAKPLVRLRKIYKVPRQIFGNKVVKYAHKADVVRLQILMEYGGIYLDSDVFVYRNLDPLLHHDFVIGKEEDIGAANAVILANRHSKFLKGWYNSYRTFDGLDWNAHSVKLPLRLAKEMPEHVCVMPRVSFFYPSWKINHCKFVHTQDEYIFNNAYQSQHSVFILVQKYAYHAFNHFSYQWLRNVTPEYVRTHDSSFTRLLRPFLEEEIVGNDSGFTEWVNKTVFFIGDDNDRMAGEYFCRKMKGVVTSVDLFGRVIVPRGRKKELRGGDPWVCVVRKKNGLLILVSITHFGVNKPSNETLNDHSNPWLNSTHPQWTILSNKLKMIPYVLHSVAKELYPEWCKPPTIALEPQCPEPIYDIRYNETEIDAILNDKNRIDVVKKYKLDQLSMVIDNRSNPEPIIDQYVNNGLKLPFWFPSPDFILAQSSLSDFNYWMGNSTVTTHQKLLPEMNQWSTNANENFFNVIQTMFPNVPIVTRTTPITITRVPSRSTMYLNDLTRSLGEAIGLRVIDWAEKAKGVKFLDRDGIYANKAARLILLEEFWKEFLIFREAKSTCMKRLFPEGKSKPKQERKQSGTESTGSTKLQPYKGTKTVKVTTSNVKPPKTKKLEPLESQ
ncbi:hypothetical protein HDU76_001513 [Blyttiomyces sp. JEL0837]|nr:hypothetical protein HDU76_001513 [Blyttiomyces sp. JEL0837]